MLIRLPVHVVEELHRLRAAEVGLRRSLGRDPTAEEVASAAGMEAAKATQLAAWAAAEPVSLEMPVADDGAELGEFIEDRGAEPFDLAAGALDADLLRRALWTLPPRERNWRCRSAWSARPSAPRS